MQSLKLSASLNVTKKCQAINLINQNGFLIADVASQLGVSKRQVYRWLSSSMGESAKVTESSEIKQPSEVNQSSEINQSLKTNLSTKLRQYKIDEPSVTMNDVNACYVLKFNEVDSMAGEQYSTQYIQSLAG